MKKCMLLLLCVCLLSGCTKSNIVPDGSDEQYEDAPQPVGGIVWEQLWEDFDAIYADPNDYPFVETVNGGVYPGEGYVRFFLLLNTTISEEEAAEFAETAIKGFNDLISEQNGNYAPSSDESYGGFVEQYNIYVMVGPDDTKVDKSTWILEDTIPAGQYRPVRPGVELDETQG